MRRRSYERDTSFNPGVLKNLLLGLTVSPETEKRLGVPAARLEQWVRDLAESLDDGPVSASFSAQSGSAGKLSAGEIRFLLEGFKPEVAFAD